LLATSASSQSFSLDNTFGNQGVITSVDASDVYFIDFDDNGNIIAIASKIGSQPSDYHYLSIIKTDANGVVMETFGNEGVMILTDYANARIYSSQITNENKILVFGYFSETYFGDSQAMFMQFAENGNLDESFGNNGKIIINTALNDDVYANCASFGSSDFLLVGKRNHLDFSEVKCYISKYNYDGNLDESFGQEGNAYLTDNATYRIVPLSIYVLDDQSVLVAEFNEFKGDGNYELALCKLDQNGNLVTDFANNGVWLMDIVQDFNLDYEYFNKIIENNGDIIVSGKGKEGKLFLSKFSTTGVIDTNFGENGFYYSEIQGYTEFNPVLINWESYIIGNHDRIISVNENGISDNNLFTFEDIIYHDMKMQGKNKIIVGGFYNDNFVITRLNANSKSGEDPASLEKNQLNTLSIYPNPAKDNLYFNEETQAEIIDIQGRVLYKTTEAVKSVNISNLKSGIYFIKTDNKIQKFVKE